MQKACLETALCARVEQLMATRYVCLCSLNQNLLKAEQSVGSYCTSAHAHINFSVFGVFVFYTCTIVQQLKHNHRWPPDRVVACLCIDCIVLSTSHWYYCLASLARLFNIIIIIIFSTIILDSSRICSAQFLIVAEIPRIHSQSRESNSHP